MNTLKEHKPDEKFNERLIPVPITCTGSHKLQCSYRKCGRYFTSGYMLMSSVLGTSFLQRGNEGIGPVTRPWGRPFCSGQCVEDDSK